ncbi:MAG: 4'-phosphopantetheinyl transferase family protein [Steroidobacteraceae bacterium]
MRLVTPDSQFNPATPSSTFAALFPGSVAAAELRAPGDPRLLLPEEAQCVARAVPKRMQEFAAGRLCARRALRQFGVTQFPIRAACDRQPLWPERLIGSITHTAGLCAAVVAERARVLALGVDSEVSGAVKPELWPSICTAAELQWLDSLPTAERPAAATLIFCAKEAFYKCQYPLVGQRLDFQDVVVTPRAWGAPQGAFALVPARPLALLDRAAGEVRCAYRFHEQFVSAGVCAIAAAA